MILDLENHTKEEVCDMLHTAKHNGCVAVFAEIISTSDGSVMSSSLFEAIQVACTQNDLFFVVDEALSAIRCGAPFAFQGDEYIPACTTYGGPDFVVFGKGLGVSGIGINFDGQMVRKLGFKTLEQRQLMVAYWQALVSRPIQLPVLIEAIGLLHLAKQENWIAISVKVGESVRKLISHFGKRKNGREEAMIRGVHAMIFVERDSSLRFPIMTAIRRRSAYARWLPKLDASMMDLGMLQSYVFSAHSSTARVASSLQADMAGTMPLWCFSCGIWASDDNWCRTCLLASCSDGRCLEVFPGHPCLVGEHKGSKRYSINSLEITDADTKADQ
jgi:hypothetical protein